MANYTQWLWNLQQEKSRGHTAYGFIMNQNWYMFIQDAKEHKLIGFARKSQLCWGLSLFQCSNKDIKFSTLLSKIE